ncbi:MAG TPA: class I SAM-dependent methyltransferase [Devosia sp.]|nr:class I SAM-dependent methyltransferase [Devosia sp.]
MSDNRTSEQFWENHYQNLTREPTGKPSAILVQYAADLTPGRSLDLGSSRGDDVMWLARQGWQSLGVDVSSTAIATAQRRAKEAGLAEAARFERHDLAATFPEGAFDLLTALFFQSPVDFPRAQVLARAAEAVASGGLLLIVEHASAAPWSWSPDAVFPTAEETLSSLQLDTKDWTQIFVGAPERLAHGPDNQTATVRDNVLALRRGELAF